MRPIHRFIHRNVCAEDIDSFHSIGTAVVLVEYWDTSGDIFQKFEIDVLSCGSPQEARKLLGMQ